MPRIDAGRLQGVSHEAAENIVAHAADDRRFAPNRARSTATFAAQPPIARFVRSVNTSSPGCGRCSIGSQRWSATTIPAHRQSKGVPFIDLLSPGVGLGQQPLDQRHHVVLVIEFGRLRDLTIVEALDELALAVVDEDRRRTSQPDFGVKIVVGIARQDVQQVGLLRGQKVLNPFAKCLRRLVFCPA